MLRTILRCTQYDMLTLDIKIGQIYFCTDSKCLYEDAGSTLKTRLRFNAIILNSENERINARAVVGKFYYIIETNTLWLFDTRWVLKSGNKANYNAYSTDKNILSAAINTDKVITSSTTGDRIIDNNGLLNNGAVCVRDNNRIIRSIFEVDNIRQQVNIKSYLDNGLVFIPNAHLPYQNMYTSFGALHLGVDRQDNINEETTNGFLTYSGKANYYGEWNTYGNMYCVQLDNYAQINPCYTPIVDKEIVKIYISCETTGLPSKYTDDENYNETHGITDEKETQIITYIVIRPTSDSEALIQVLSMYNKKNNSTIINDKGDLIFNNTGDLLYSNIITSTRKSEVNHETGIYTSTYNLDIFDKDIIISGNENNITNVVIPELWYDDTTDYVLDIKKWTKKAIVTEDVINEMNNKLLILESRLAALES